MIKKIFCTAITLFMMCLFIPIAANAATIVDSGECGAQGDNVTWTLDSEGILTISGNGDMYDMGYSNQPWYDERGSIKKVVINNGVTNIGAYAFFSCDSLTSISIPDSVTSIGEHAFRNCGGLTSVTIPGSVASIGDSAFYWCRSLTSVTIPGSVTYIGDHAFTFCLSLTSMTIQDGVTSIGNSAFSSCSSLTSVTIPDSVTSIGNSAFSSCSSLTSVTIPDSVTSIGDSAFDGCSSLTSVTIPDSVTTIGDSVFSGCSKLKDVYYTGNEDAWTFIEIGSSNTYLTNATIYYNYGKITSGDYGKTDNDNIQWSFDIKTGVLTLSGNGFMRNVTGKNIPWYMYRKNITDIVIEHGIYDISYNTFDECINLKTVTIPYTVISIKSTSFYQCSEDFTIKGYANSAAEKYASSHSLPFESLGNMPIETLFEGKCGDDVYYRFDTQGTMTITGSGAMDDYTNPWPSADASPPWYTYIAYIVAVKIDNGITHIGDYAFYYEYPSIDITSLQLPVTLKSIGDNAFTYKCNIESITFPEGLEDIGKQAFRLCGIKEVTFPNSMKNIGDYAFYLNNFREINLGNGVETIGAYAFAGSYSLDGEKCQLESVTIPNSVVSMDAAFCWQYDLKNIYVDEENGNFKSVDGILYSKDGKNLIFCPAGFEKGRVEVCDGTEIISERAFDGCSKITEIIIPEGVTNLKSSFASGCDSLNCLYIPSTVTEVEGNTFFSSLGYYGRDISDIYYNGSKENWNSLIEKDKGFPKMYGNKTNFHFNAIGINPPKIADINMVGNDTGMEIGVSFTDVEYDNTLITAFYKEGVLVDIERTPIQTGSVYEEISVPNELEADEAKSFIWNSLESMKPLCEAKKIQLK